MTAHRSPATALALGLLALAAALGCAHRTQPVSDDLLVPLASPTRWGPEPSDLAAVRLAEAALASDPAPMHAALAELRAADDDHATKGLPALAQDLVNATLDDRVAYRAAAKELKKQKGVDHALKARLEQSIENDALSLARRRRLDTWEEYWARTFNAVSEPIGRALMTGAVTAPFTIATSGAHYLASFSNDEPISPTHRQALVLHREYVAHNPDAEDAEKIRRQIAKAERKLDETLQKRRLREARRQLGARHYRAAKVSAERALLHGESAQAERIIAKAGEAIARQEARRAASLDARADDARSPVGDEATRLATALLASSDEPLRVSELRRLGIDGNGPLAPELAFAEAIARIESGYEDAGRARLDDIARHDPADDPMARHAATLVYNHREDPYLAFRRLKSSQRWALVRYRFFGEWTKGTRYPRLPKPVAYLIESPGVAQTFATTPLRLVFGAWDDHPDFDTPTAVAAYRYLALEPEGEHQREVLEWLVDFEQARGNSVGALRNADFIAHFEPKRREKLLEEASEQALASATRLRRADEQQRMLREVARQFPDTEAGNEAGTLAREQALAHSAQHIRVTKSFFEENPRVAGEDGLGLRPALLNGRVEDGELHPEGVTFLGGRRIMIALVDESGDEDDPPKHVYRTISDRRVGRTAALLDTTVRKNQLIDPDEELGADGDRDQYIERAALGLTGEADERPTARSTYVYRSMRERYGMVRGRESVLPVDLVFQGSFTDLSLNAFPRWRPPRKTPDAFLYE